MNSKPTGLGDTWFKFQDKDVVFLPCFRIPPDHQDYRGTINNLSSEI
jgi:hypothetical protein